MPVHNQFICYLICSRKKILNTRDQSTTDQRYTVVMRQCLVLQCDVLSSSAANANLHVNEMHILLMAVA